jgi:hypothetical protein
MQTGAANGTTAYIGGANAYIGGWETTPISHAIASGGASTPATTSLLKGNGSANGVSAATPGTDYVVPSGSITGTAAGLSGTPALPSGTTATTQTQGDSSTKVATDAFVAAAVSSSETVTFSATPTFSTTTHSSIITLTANITSFTLAAGQDGQEKTLTFCQNATGGFTVAGPANVHGFFTIGTVASKCNAQRFIYSVSQTAWLADSVGITNE